MTASLIYRFICQLVLYLIFHISHSINHHTCRMCLARELSFPCQTLSIDYLALVDPVDVKTFWIHLHSDRKGLCGVLDGEKGISVHAHFGHVSSSNTWKRTASRRRLDHILHGSSFFRSHYVARQVMLQFFTKRLTHLWPFGEPFPFNKVVLDHWRLQKVSFLIHFALLQWL